MSSREDLHSLVDQLPEERLDHVGMMLSSILNPRPNPPEMEELHKRAREYRTRVEEQFRKTRKPRTISGMGGGGGDGGGGFFSVNKDRGAFSSHSFHYWDDKAIVYQTMRYFSGQQIEQMERLSVSEDGQQLLYEQEISSGGRTARRQEAFPKES